MDRDGWPERLPTFEELHASARERLEYWVEGARLEFTEALWVCMDDGGVGRTELARRVGVSPAYITKVLSGGGNFTLATMAKLAKALDREVRIHLAPVDTVTDWTDIPMHVARAMRWSPSGRHGAPLEELLALRGDTGSAPDKQPGADDARSGHARLTVAA